MCDIVVVIVVVVVVVVVHPLRLPWNTFLTLDAKVEFQPFMTQEDLAGADLDSLGQKWG